MNNEQLKKVVPILKKEIRKFKTPYVTEVSDATGDPFKVLVSCILSLRTKDETTAAASKRIFKLAKTPVAMSKLRVKAIEKAIYPVGFFRNKAVTLKELSKKLVSDYSSKVPNTIDGLLEFKGVGRKTANLVVTMGYGLPGICVDIHVHRITNRWGYVETSTPDQTEEALRKKLPQKYWQRFNEWLVGFGQTVCKPMSPLCSQCPVDKHCPRTGVGTHR